MNRFVAAVVLTAATGCTMCPDPYDYSGPVPNGSAPQNDFRARSNGILPIGAAPKPWPPIVERKAETPGNEAVVSAGDVRVPDLVAKALAADLANDMGPEDDASIAVARVSAEEVETTESDESGTEPIVVPEVELAPVEEEAASVEADPPSEVDTGMDEPVAILPPPQPASEVPVGPVPRETPGWRPRSQ
ncbi:MAG: hypothetical protein WCC69_14575 [Pirellulales bacterium]